MPFLALIVGLVLFLGIHAFTMNRSERARLIRRMGETRYRLTYSLLSLTGLVLIIYGYGVYRSSGEVPIWFPPFWTRHVTFSLMLIAFILLASSYTPSHIRFFVKDPMITAIILWSAGHLLVRGDVGSMLMFGGFLAWGALARISMARRMASDVQGPPPVATPRWQADIVAVVIGCILYAAFLFWLHPLLIGVPLLAT
jgi:uncharacterized membrane protein